MQIRGHVRPALGGAPPHRQARIRSGTALGRVSSVLTGTSPSAFTRPTARPWFLGRVFRGRQSVERPAVIRQGRAVLREGPGASQRARPVLGGLCQLPHSLRVQTGSRSISVPFFRRLVVVGMAVFQMGA